MLTSWLLPFSPLPLHRSSYRAIPVRAADHGQGPLLTFPIPRGSLHQAVITGLRDPNTSALNSSAYKGRRCPNGLRRDFGCTSVSTWELGKLIARSLPMTTTVNCWESISDTIHGRPKHVLIHITRVVHKTTSSTSIALSIFKAASSLPVRRRAPAKIGRIFSRVRTLL